MHSVVGFLFGLVVLASPAASQVITTVAGNGLPGFSGDGSGATSASLDLPTAVVVDSLGNLYISDQTNQRVRKVDLTGIITTVAGNGIQGFAGDGGPATSASLFAPLGLALDRVGNLYIADQLNQRIRKIDTAGIITTAAGNGAGGFAGDGGLATNASLLFPSGVLVDPAGALWIADRNNQRIRKVDPLTGIITTVAGDGIQGFGGDGGPATQASFSSPVDIALDTTGNLFIVDQLNQRIRKVDTSGTITTVAGNGVQAFSGDGGPAIAASLALPLDVVVDPRGNLFIADLLNQRIRKVDGQGFITTVAGTGVQGYGGDGALATSAILDRPRSITLNRSGDLFIADLFNHRVRKVGLSPISRLANLLQDVQALGLRGMAGQAQLGAAIDALGREPVNIQAAVGAIQAFINFVGAQAGKKITFVDADALVVEAQAILGLLTG